MNFHEICCYSPLATSLANVLCFFLDAVGFDSHRRSSLTLRNDELISSIDQFLDRIYLPRSVRRPYFSPPHLAPAEPAISAMRRFLMCEPKFFTVLYEISPLMKAGAPVDRDLAWKQWRHLRETLEHCGAKIELLTPVAGSPDLVFTADAGVCYKNSVFLSRFMHKERQAEELQFHNWFQSNGMKVFTGAEPFEGGDALIVGKKAFFASGPRTVPKAIGGIIDALNLRAFGLTTLLVNLIDPRYVHLDACFAPITDELGVWYPAAFDVASREKLLKTMELIEVPSEEASRFACSCVTVGKHVVMPERCEQTAREIQRRGYEVHTCDMSEFLKAGGATKCLVFSLN